MFAKRYFEEKIRITNKSCHSELVSESIKRIDKKLKQVQLDKIHVSSLRTSLVQEKTRGVWQSEKSWYHKNKQMKILKCFFRLLLVDFFLALWYCSYHIDCEPCLDDTDCPPCLSKEQYFIIYLAIGVNLIFGLYCLYRNRKKWN